MDEIDELRARVATLEASVRALVEAQQAMTRKMNMSTVANKPRTEALNVYSQILARLPEPG